MVLTGVIQYTTDFLQHIYSFPRGLDGKCNQYLEGTEKYGTLLQYGDEITHGHCKIK
jgi:hypothetical protein